MKKGLKTNIIY